MTEPTSTPDWAIALLGEGTALVTVLAGGSSRETLLLEVAAGRHRVVARHDRGHGPLSGTPFTLAREAATFAAAASAGLPAPALVAVAPDGSAFAVEQVPGTPEAGTAALDDYLRCLGRLHAAGVAVAPDGYAGFDPAGAEDLAIWERAASELAAPAPIVELAFARLRAHGAFQPERPVLCHGDAGPGNYLHEGAHVTGLIDWEMAHTGDLHDDLASIAVRGVLSGIDLGDLPARIAEHHTPVAGEPFDRRRHRIAVLGVLTRMVVSCLRSLEQAAPDGDRSVQLLGLPLMEVHLLRTIGDLDGTPLQPLDDVDPDLAFAAELAAASADVLSRLLPGVTDDAVAGQARRLRFAARQMAAALAEAEPPPAEAPDLDVLWRAAQRRLAVLPASRPIANAPIAGAT